MDDTQLKDLIPAKEQNPLLKRKPLNLGTHFIHLSSPEQPIEIENILIRPHLTLLFFTAQWCNISKSFLSNLLNFYEEVNLEEKKVEIVYVGFDKNKKDYELFTKKMPWLGIGFSDQRVQGLKEFYDMRAIPKLVLIDSKGEQVQHDCRQDLYAMEPDAALEKWQQLRVKQDKSYYYQEAA